MPYSAEIIDIFVSSPGDVSGYRNQIMSITQAWNQRNGKSRGLFFNCLRWEDLVASDLAESGQEVINQHIPPDYDLFLGVMWARFGTPTSNAQSGTEEEFDRAFTRYDSGENVRLSFLFCTADVPFSKLDGEQFQKVQTFKKRVQDRGCLTRDFVDDASLINSVNLILDKFANRSKEVEFSSVVDERIIEISAKPPSERPTEDDSDTDIGLLDVLEDFEHSNENYLNNISEWGAKLESVSVSLNTTTEKFGEISKFGQPSTAQVREILSKLTEDLNVFAIWCEESISELELQISAVSRNMILIVDVSQNSSDTIDEINGAKDAFINLVEMIESANESISDFVASMESSPRLDKKLNKANRRIVTVHNRLIQKNAIFADDIKLCISELKDRVEARQANLLLGN